LETGELERLRRVGVGQGVRLGLRRRVRTVKVTTPLFSCCRAEGTSPHLSMLTPHSDVDMQKKKPFQTTEIYILKTFKNTLNFELS
jgi:hypothetical protein